MIYQTADRNFATYLYNIGYKDYIITIIDGVKVWSFNIHEKQLASISQLKKKFYK